MLILFLLLSVATGVTLFKNSINILTPESLDYALENKLTVLAVWNAVDCKKCAADMWDIYQLFYAYEQEEFVIMATDLGEFPDLETRYQIPLSDEGSIFRLFVKGSPSPFMLNEEGLDVETWIGLKTGFTPKEDLIFNLSDDTHEKFLKLTKKADSFIMLYIPQNPKSQKLANYFSHVAELFKDYKKIQFARVNCYETPGLCTFFNAPNVPAFRFVPWNMTAWHGKQIRYDDGENVIDYLNKQLHTYYDMSGGMNTLFGREEPLDDLAHLFMEAETRKDKLRIMKRVSKLKNTYRASYRYYKVMKEMLSGGEEALQQYKDRVDADLAALEEVKSNDYLKLRALQNVAYQFERLQLQGSSVELTPYNFDYIVNGKRDVIVLFCAPWSEDCNTFKPTFEELAKENHLGFVFGSMDADAYVHFVARYRIKAYPYLLWFKNGEDPKFPYVVNAELTKESITDFIDEQYRQNGNTIEEEVDNNIKDLSDEL